ncbi:MAG: 6-phosphofructokinase [Massilioclostridium sp.]|nr:6-phosphofructokinase [Massilioclostridium sp.]MEE1491441.1 6-phosphofructokinase [Massilioclostridium sp.]
MTVGNILVGQSGGPTAVINASLAGVFKAAKDMGADKIYGMRNGVQGLLNERLVNLLDCIQTDRDLEILKSTPASYLGSCRFKLPDVEVNEAVYQQVFRILIKFGIRHFFYIGGNDSMDTIKKLAKYAKSIGSDINFVGVPKTIDNDLAVTDHTPGYGSAAKYIATAVKEVICDARVYDIPSVTIVEIMGRNAGWLTAASALSKGEDCDGPDLIYLPETTFNMNKFVTDINRVHKTKKVVTVAVSEGLKIANGKYVCDVLARDEVDAFGHKKLGGTANVLADFVALEAGCKTRYIELNTLQRCASHIASKTDVEEAYTAGFKAAHASFNGETGKMVIFKRVSNDPYQLQYATYDIDKVANIEKRIPFEWIIRNNTYVSDELVEYMKPLIQGEMLPPFENGLPMHLRLCKE